MTEHAADKFSGTDLVSISLKARDLADSAIIAYWTESYGRGIDFHRRGAIDSLRALADLCGFDLVEKPAQEAAVAEAQP